jgi:hypothetical protein
MDPDKKYRTFLLGIADPETEASVEEEIFDGRIDQDHLQQIEEELIDDLLFGRLSIDEERKARSVFLTTPQRINKFEFARALQQQAALHSPEVRHRTVFAKSYGLAARPWIVPLAGALSCAVLAVAWLGERDVALNQELAQALRTNGDHQRIIKSLREEQERGTNQPVPLTQPTLSKAPAVSVADQTTVQPSIRLSPGANRGLATVSVLRLNRLASSASFVLELLPDRQNALREELLSSDNKTIWSQQFSVTTGISNNGVTTIILPAAIFSTGEYRLRVETGPNLDELEESATYLFRVRRD